MSNNLMNKMKMLGTTATASVALALFASQSLMGVGLIVPNGDDPKTDNQYYQVVDTSLFLFDCEDGALATSESCKTGGVSLGNYKKIYSSVESELTGLTKKLTVDIESETRALKEKDIKVADLRKTISTLAGQKDALSAQIQKLSDEKAIATKNAKLALDEISKIDNKLKSNPDHATLTRVLKEQTRYKARFADFSKEEAKLEASIAANRAEIETKTDAIAKSSQDLTSYMDALVVTSPELTKLSASLTAYRTELNLLPELNARLTDPETAFDLRTWSDAGAPELFARLVKHIQNCRR